MSHGTDTSRGQTTRILAELRAGDETAAERLLPVVYAELRRIAAAAMRRERAGHTLQPTAVVHEAFLRLVGSKESHWSDRSHFIGVAARAMRQLLVDHARRRGAARHGGDHERVTLAEADGASHSGAPDVDVVALHAALEKLARLDARQARVVELRYFGGLTAHETAEVLGLSRRTVNGDWLLARAWLYRELKSSPGDA